MKAPFSHSSVDQENNRIQKQWRIFSHVTHLTRNIEDGGRCCTKDVHF